MKLHATYKFNLKKNQIHDSIELNSNSILIKSDSNSIEEKWDEIWCKMY